MSKAKYSDEELSEMIEDAFVNIKEACLRLQERTMCGNDVVINMLEEVTQYYINKEQNSNK